MSVTHEILVARKQDLVTQIDAYTKELQRLEDVRVRAVAELNYLRGAEQLADELLALYTPETTAPEPSPAPPDAV